VLAGQSHLSSDALSLLGTIGCALQVLDTAEHENLHPLHTNGEEPMMETVADAITRQRNFVEAMHRADGALQGRNPIMTKLCYDEIVRDKKGRVIAHPLAMDANPHFHKARDFGSRRRRALDEEGNELSREDLEEMLEQMREEDGEDSRNHRYYREDSARYHQDANRHMHEADDRYRRRVNDRRRHRADDDLDVGPQAAHGNQGMGSQNPKQVPWLDGEDRRRGRYGMDSGFDDLFGATRITVM
jgi:hypothetical protein